VPAQCPTATSPQLVRDANNDRGISRFEEQRGLARSRGILAKNHMHAEIVVRIGQTADTIVTFASRRHCEEIVMGTRGMGNLKGLLLGSITIKVIHLARVSVTVVP
jgi:nucleotide-binding universal stress UspA family protein